MNRTTLTTLAMLALLIASPCPAQIDSAPPSTLISPRDYSFGFYPNGWRRGKDDATKDLLRIETGYYGFEIDTDDIAHPRFSLFKDGADAAQVFADGTSHTSALAPAELSIEIKVGEKIYRPASCQAGRRDDGARMEDVRLQDSGRFVQHFDLYNLDFVDDQGAPLGGSANLAIVAWPDSLTFTAQLKPSPVYKDGPILGVEGAGLCIDKSSLEIPHNENLDSPEFSLESWYKFPGQWSFAPRPGMIVSKNQHMDNDGFFGLCMRGAKLEAILNIGGGKENHLRLRAREPILKDLWNHFALTYDGKTARLYVNGKLSSSLEIGIARQPGTGSLFIGRDGQKNQGRGMVDEVRLWNRVLSPEQIADRHANPAKPVDPAGLVFEETFSRFPVPPKENWKDAEISLSFKGAGREWSTKQKVENDWFEGEASNFGLRWGEARHFSLPCDVGPARLPADDVAIRVLREDIYQNPITVVFNPLYNCFYAKAYKLKRDWHIKDNADLGRYDDIPIELENNGTQAGTVPFLLELFNPWGIPGVLPVLCHEDGRPTGVPVQTSKNWHISPAYVRAYTMLPAPVGKSRYLLRFSYGFFGTVPQASHTQLSLVGWGGHGRWDQIAVGGWGETLCLNLDQSAADNIITDNRGMLTRNGKDGPLWQWVEAGWGGDWLSVKNSAGENLRTVGAKALYTTHGPCLSEIEYRGWLGQAREVAFHSMVRVPRTDDYARTFFRNTYSFAATLSAKNSFLFKVGDSFNYVTPRVAYGNLAGLIAEQTPPASAKPGDVVVERLELEGEGPWWVAFPEGKALLPPGREKFGTAAKALVIRSYKATFGGQTFTRPSISLVVHSTKPDGKSDLDLLLTPPDGVENYQPGDKVEMDLEWITVPHCAEDYYGPNEALRQHLAEFPRSWKTVHREAAGNNLVINATGATVTNRYPVILQVGSPTAPDQPSSGVPRRVVLDITGGVAQIPVRFEGLKTPLGFKLHEEVDGKPVEFTQAVHGNDYWQADFDPLANTYSLTFNLPTDGKPKSRWIFETPE